jgi:hypothetical protein
MALINGLFPVLDLGFTHGCEWGSFPCHGEKIYNFFLNLPNPD